MFEDTSVEGIKNRILERLTTQLQTREGSFTNDVVSAVAAEICECYHSMDAMLPMFYVEESSGIYIDRQAAVVGVTRKMGTKASCSITFTGTSGASVPAGTVFYTESGLAFHLREKVTLAGSAADGILDAAEPGDLYNIGEGDIVSTMHNYPGITGYRNAAASGGAEQESDVSLLSRYWTRMRQTATSGNPYHYQIWATSVDGVRAAQVISKWNGAGTVKIILAGDGMKPPEASIVDACTQFIESQRPIGPEITVEAAQAKDLTLSATVLIEGSTSLETVRAAWETAVKDYLAELVSAAFSAPIDLQLERLEEKRYFVLYNRIAFLLLSVPGVTDYSALLLNNGTESIAVEADHLPVLTEVTLT